VVDQFGCPECFYNCSTKDMIVKHLKQKHDNTNKKWLNVCIQSLNKGTNRALLRVNPRKTVLTTAEPCLDTEDGFEKLNDEFQSFSWQRSRAGLPIPNARKIHPFLIRTQWHIHVADFETTELRTLVRASDPGEYPLVQRTIHEYFVDCSGLLSLQKTHVSVLELLNSPEPGKINNKPLQAHHQETVTLQQYIALVQKLIISLLRKSQNYQYPQSVALKTALEQLVMDPKLSALHHVLKALWLCRWYDPVDKPNGFPDPTMCFMALIHIRPEGEFSDPKDVPQPIAKLSLRAITHYASAIAYSTISPPKIWWDDQECYTSLRYKGRSITETHIHTLFERLQDKIIRLWEDKILGGLSHRVTYGSLADNLTNCEPGYSFLDDVENRFSDHFHDLLRLFFADPQLRKQFFHVPGGSQKWEFNSLRWRVWLADLADLEKHLILAVDMMGGAPARGTEITSVLIRNTPFRVRNMRGLGKFVAMVREYSKTTNIMQADKVIPHAMDAFCADIFIQVHVLARPIAQYLASKLYPNDPGVAVLYGEMAFMDAGKEFSSESLSTTMANSSLPILGWGLKISAWRDVTVAFKRKRCNKTMALLNDDETFELHMQQNGHSIDVNKQHYGTTPFSFLGYPEDVIFAYLMVSTEWQRLFHIVPGGIHLPYSQTSTRNYKHLYDTGFLRTKLFPGPMLSLSETSEKSHDWQIHDTLLEFTRQQQSRDEAHMQEIENLKATITSLQRSNADTQKQNKELHTLLSVALPLLGSLVSNNTVTSQSLSHSVNTITTLAHISNDNLSFIPLVADQQCSPRSCIRVIHVKGELQLRKILDGLPYGKDTEFTYDMICLLKGMYGPSIQWRCQEQRDAVEALLALRTDVVIALGCGVGKTAVILLASLVENGHTIVVTPLVSLLQDWQRRLRTLNIAFEHYAGAQTKTLSGHANIILASADTARGKHWEACLNMLSRPVYRIVVEEVHNHATEASFRRKAFANPYQLRNAGPVQLVLMSASVPVPLLNTLSKSFELRPGFKVFRTPAVKDNVIFIRHKPLGNDSIIAETVTSYIQSWKQAGFHNTDDRYIVYVYSTKQGEALAKCLGCDFYHSASQTYPITDQERRTMLDRWITGDNSTLVSTTALSAGLDCHGIVMAFNIGVPPELITYYQQTHRLVRGEGGVGVCILIPWPKKPVSDRGDKDILALCGREELLDLAYFDISAENFPMRCLRYRITKFLNGRGQTCAAIDATLDPCTGCLPGQYSPAQVLDIY
ncbi:uncharacterized protein C8R40DRAFT_1061908, partial [Lentinula edodes]|uniref:uncharacterized protein n=1 Tax=Lentinula edodes TaxID=5353 RepID=UPI001E8D4F27